MRRRVLIASMAVAATAGCSSEKAPSGPRTPPGADIAREGPPGEDANDERAPGLFVDELDFFEGDEGMLVLEVVVANDADEERSGTVVAMASGPDRTVEVTEDVTVPSDETVELDLQTDLEYEAFASGGELSVEVERA